jgi:hypothetical protein
MAVVLAIVSFCWISTPLAAESVINAKIDSATVLKDKNGAEYVRLIVAESKEMGGIKYSKTVPVLAFRDQVTTAKTLRAGDMLKAVVSHSATPDGRESYRIVSFPQAEAKPAKK